MIRCPVCQGARVVIVLDAHRRARCLRCGARWVQEGSFQRAIRANHPSVGALGGRKDPAPRPGRVLTLAGTGGEGQPAPGEGGAE